VKTAGTSISAMCTSARSRDVSASRMTRIHGNGCAASIPGPTQASKWAGPRRPLSKPVRILRSSGDGSLPGARRPDYQAWRDQRDWTARKYAMWERGERMPSQKSNSLMRCACAETFDSHRLAHTLIHVPHITRPATRRNLSPMKYSTERPFAETDSGRHGVSDRYAGQEAANRFSR
jgi:hypothetical protein